MSQISKRVLLASAFAFLVVALLACPSKPTPAGGSAVANFVGLRCNKFSGPV